MFGKINNGQNRKILVKLKNYDDKEAILRSNSSSYIISNFQVNGHTDIHKMHMDFCKKALNVSKFCSISAVSTELGLFPLDNQAYSLTVKYWLRLVNSTDNELLNECYIDSVNGNFEWLDGIRAILKTNGFGYVWNNPLSVNKDTFHKIFRQRLHDQYIQDLNRKIESSNRFTLLHTLTGDISVFKTKSYIKLIKSPDIRNIYTRLRIDCHMLETSQPKLHKSSNGIDL